MSAPDFDSFSRQLNIWRDEAAEFRRKFADHREMGIVAAAITDTLSAGLDLPTDMPEHPFNRYADEDLDWSPLMERLRNEVRNKLETSRLRGYATSFFATGGVNREAFEELFEAFDAFAFESFIPSGPNDELAEHPDNELDDLSDDEDDDDDYADDAVPLIDLTNPNYV
jgi:hypothetical protein